MLSENQWHIQLQRASIWLRSYCLSCVMSLWNLLSFSKSAHVRRSAFWNGRQTHYFHQIPTIHIWQKSILKEVQPGIWLGGERRGLFSRFFPFPNSFPCPQGLDNSLNTAASLLYQMEVSSVDEMKQRLMDVWHGLRQNTDRRTALNNAEWFRRRRACVCAKRRHFVHLERFQNYSFYEHWNRTGVIVLNLPEIR